MSRTKVRRALLSVSDKAGLVDFAARLVATGVELIASGGTAASLQAAGLPVTPVATVTGAPEMLDGRVKTLHPRIHGAILADLGNQQHRNQLYESGISPIQLVVVNLYPFEEGVAKPTTTEAEAIELIDIGGPTMVRAAAKNHKWVGIVTNPAQYDRVAAGIEEGGLDDDLRLELAREAFYRTARYDAAIVSWLERSSDEMPERLVLSLDRVRELRYGENPHQTAALYAEQGNAAWWGAMGQLQGKEMSFNNYLDTEAAWRLVNEFSAPTAVVVKHANPCGVAVGPDLATALRRAWDCDPISAFGGIVALNGLVDADLAAALTENFIEVVIAPAIAQDAVAIFAKRRNLRVLEAVPPRGRDLDLRRVEHGFVVQRRDEVTVSAKGGLPAEWESVGDRGVDPEAMLDLVFAWKVAAHTKSNAIVVSKDRAAVGIGAGDQSRVGAADRALRQAGPRARGGVAASDGFFPFRDTIDLLARAGVIAVVEPGGSVRDEDVVAAANEQGMAIVFAGKRHFRH
jgi:phosphoribosylaminoimidazolecarboxamide formyltransferase/IMP cyclohydrolase